MNWSNLYKWYECHTYRNRLMQNYYLDFTFYVRGYRQHCYNYNLYAMKQKPNTCTAQGIWISESFCETITIYISNINYVIQGCSFTGQESFQFVANHSNVTKCTGFTSNSDTTFDILWQTSLIKLPPSTKNCASYKPDVRCKY